MSKVIKSAGKSIKNAIKKNLPESKLGRALLIAATIYVGGAALGAWNAGGSLARVNGILVKGGGAAGGTASGTAAGNAARMAAMPTGVETLTVTAPAATGAGAATTAATTGAAGAAMDTIATRSTQLPSNAPRVSPSSTEEMIASGAQGVEPPKGIITRMMEGAGTVAKNVGKYAVDNPMPTAMLLQGAASAAAPDEIDVMREQQKQQLRTQEQERERINRNLMDVANVNINMPLPAKRPMTFFSTGEPVFASGLIRTNMGA